ncbi:MAG: hypothetical protein C5B52_11295 [Bacteroidetes bacterium]|nr:MAG: hypothetical protein C5B52_11295 [Bacteroidota bacterium]
MKNAIRKIFPGEPEVQEYITIKVGEEIWETVFLETNRQSINISGSHWLLSLEPMVIGVFLCNKIQIGKNQEFKIRYKSKNSTFTEAVMFGSYFDSFDEPEGTLYLFEINRTNIFQKNWLFRTGLYRRYFVSRQPSKNKYKSLVGAFSYPRKVKLVSFKQDHYYNIFPMDLLGEVGAGYHVFGLRHSNIALEKMLQSAKVVVSDISFEHKKIIYDLGKHHGTNPPPVQQLPFQVNLTSKFGFYIPEWIENYREIEITRKLNLGSHMLLWGKILQTVNMAPKPTQLAHIHFLHYLQLKKFGENYPKVD